MLRLPIMIGLVGAVVLVGCNRRPARVRPPSINARAAGKAAIAQYDTDGNGVLSGDELEKAPALRTAMARLDVDPQDGQITAAEVSHRIEAWQTTRLAVLPVGCRVLLDGQPLDGAAVTFEPEPFLGDAVKPATGTTVRYGTTDLSVAEQFRPAPTVTGVQCGFYKVRVSRQFRGKEMIPAKFNAATTLGFEIASDAAEVQNSGTITLNLTKE